MSFWRIPRPLFVKGSSLSHLLGSGFAPGRLRCSRGRGGFRIVDIVNHGAHLIGLAGSAAVSHLGEDDGFVLQQNFHAIAGLHGHIQLNPHTALRYVSQHACQAQVIHVEEIDFHGLADRVPGFAPFFRSRISVGASVLRCRAGIVGYQFRALGQGWADVGGHCSLLQTRPSVSSLRDCRGEAGPANWAGKAASRWIPTQLAPILEATTPSTPPNKTQPFDSMRTQVLGVSLVLHSIESELLPTSMTWPRESVKGSSSSRITAKAPTAISGL